MENQITNDMNCEFCNTIRSQTTKSKSKTNRIRDNPDFSHFWFKMLVCVYFLHWFLVDVVWCAVCTKNRIDDTISIFSPNECLDWTAFGRIDVINASFQCYYILLYTHTQTHKTHIQEFMSAVNISECYIDSILT